MKKLTENTDLADYIEGPTLQSITCSFIDAHGIMCMEDENIRDSVYQDYAETGSVGPEGLEPQILARTEAMKRGEWCFLIPQAHATVTTAGDYGYRTATFDTGISFMPIASDVRDSAKENSLAIALTDLKHNLAQFGLEFEDFESLASASITQAINRVAEKEIQLIEEQKRLAEKKSENENSTGLKISMDYLARTIRNKASSQGLTLSSTPKDIIQDDAKFIDYKINAGISLNQIASYLVDMHAED